MKKLIAIMCFMLAASPLAFAQDKGQGDAKKAPMTKEQAQREQAKKCNAEAREQKLKGDARKAHMKECMGRIQ